MVFKLVVNIIRLMVIRLYYVRTLNVTFKYYWVHGNSVARMRHELEDRTMSNTTDNTTIEVGSTSTGTCKITDIVDGIRYIGEFGYDTVLSDEQMQSLRDNPLFYQEV